MSLLCEIHIGLSFLNCMDGVRLLDNQVKLEKWPSCHKILYLRVPLAPAYYDVQL